MQEAIKLNNDAIDILSRSCDESSVQEGVVFLTKALRTLKHELLSREKKEKEHGRSGKRILPSRRLASIVDCPYSACRSGEVTTQCVTNFIYNRMFRLEVAREDTLSSRTIQVYIACIIFNSALLHQHRAYELEPGKVRSCLLEKASVLYHSCVQIIPFATEMIHEGSSTENLIFSLKVGALNNSAQISYECYQYEQAIERLQLVESILFTQGPSEPKCSFTIQEFEGILANCLLLKPPTVAVAA